MDERLGQELQSFWKNPVPRDRIVLVGSEDSDEFDLFCWAMERTYIVGMDSEWKPSFLSNISGNPRVSILQIACRIYDFDDDEHNSNNTNVCNTETDVVNQSECDIGNGGRNLSHKKAQWRHKMFGGVGDSQGHKVQELVFLLDLLALPVSSFGKTLKAVYVSLDILKLGFRFKQDLMYLAGSFSREEGHSYFDKVDPYIDVGKLYLNLQNQEPWLQGKGRKMSIQQTKSLSSICEEVLGVRLSKDLQCSDWEQRPLTEDQITYAAADAHCLLAIFDVFYQNFLDLHQGQARSEATSPSFSTAIVGLKELLTSQECHDNENVLRSTLGNAVEIVKATLQGPLSMASINALSANYIRRKGISFCQPILNIAQILGERILLSECVTKAKSGSWKGRSRRSRTTEKCKAEQIESYSEWQGPPPWDPLLGGDGVPRFICDVMVEGLAKQLRCVGIDAATPSVKKAEPRQLIEQAQEERRILLTRDIKILRRHINPSNQAYRVKNLAKQEQLHEVIKMFNLKICEYQLMSRCIKCNGRFIEKSLTTNEAVAATTSEQVIPEFLLDRNLEFWQCSDCRQIYWEGTQYHNAIQQFSSVCQIYD